MSIEGIWTGEVYGPFGWENRGVFLFERGRMLGGDNRQYSVGTYHVADNTMSAEIRTHYYGPPRASFGETKEQFTTRIDGSLDGDVISGTISRPDRPEFEVEIRLTKRMELPDD